MGLANLLYDRDQALRRIPDNDDAFWRRVVARLRQQLPGANFAAPPPEGALIRYAGSPGTYPRISFYQALEPQRYLPEGELAGALVIIGRDTRSAADSGAAQVDTFATPFTQAGHAHMVGMEIHANVFKNVLSGKAIRPLSAGAGVAVAAYMAERKQRLLIKQMFSRYVPEALVEQLAAHPERLTLSGEHRELTLLFTDLAGLTTLSESLTPQQTAELVNR